MKTIKIEYTITKLGKVISNYPQRKEVVATYQGQREFTSNSKAEKFLLRLEQLKLSLALRAAGSSFTKRSDLFKMKTKQMFGAAYKAAEYKKPAEEAIRANPYKLVVNIQTLRA